MNFWSHERILFLVLVLRSICIWHYADKSLFLNNRQCSQSLVFVPNPRPYRNLNTSCNVNRSVVCCRYIWPRSLCRRCIFTPSAIARFTLRLCGPGASYHVTSRGQRHCQRPSMSWQLQQPRLTTTSCCLYAMNPIVSLSFLLSVLIAVLWHYATSANSFIMIPRCAQTAQTPPRLMHHWR